MQNLTEKLDMIQAFWLDHNSRALAQGEEVRKSFFQSLTEFFESLKKALSNGDPACLNLILDSWASSLTHPETHGIEIGMTQIVHKLLVNTMAVFAEHLSKGETLELLQAVLPFFLYASEYASRKEINAQASYLTEELEKTKSSLESLERSKSDFIAIAAHELKTPLTLISGYTDMLRQNIQNSSSSSAEIELLDGINTGTQRLRGIVDDMIDVSMIDNHLLSLRFQPVWMDRLLAAILREFEPVIRDRNQIILIRPFQGIDELNFGDEERLYQAFRNMISNSIKFTPDGGKITIDGRKLPGFIEVLISDTGIGIKQEDLSRIFEKFGNLGKSSLHSSSKTGYKGGGPGLGLSIAKGILEAHGGTIWVESPGYDEKKFPGSTFHVLLPHHNESPDNRTEKLFSSPTLFSHDFNR